MEVRPIKQEYILAVANHSMRAVVLHKNNERQLSYYFDDKLITEKSMSGGQCYTDSDCIREVVDEYKKNNKGIFADLLNYHIDKVRLVSKLVELELINFGIPIKAVTKIIKDYYEVEIALKDGTDIFRGRIKADNFPEVLEKFRMFINTLEGVNAELTQNITLLSNDKIEEAIDWA